MATSAPMPLGTTQPVWLALDQANPPGAKLLVNPLIEDYEILEDLQRPDADG